MPLAPGVDRMLEEIRPPAAVSATAIFWLRVLRRVVTSSRIGRRDGGGKWVEESSGVVVVVIVDFESAVILEME